ncbi:hypothetical protein [Ureibacillus chungkukjangi]|uniref:hypothetical protein n=1 Tax=Ureibacillus chungkukjangi TaxID=1202712 RepID=UPI00203D8191|nr:hypothetical protein [Ureibacillus chungkukjangi]
MVCDEFFESDKNQGKIEEEWSDPALCPVCSSDELRKASTKEKINKGHIVNGDVDLNNFNNMRINKMRLSL